MSITNTSPTAAGSGASASEAFKASKERHGEADTSPERISAVISGALKGVHAALRENNVTYPEFQVAKAWLMEVGETGEWPLFMDVFVEHVIEEIAAQEQQGTKGSIEGPYYLPNQVRLQAKAQLPRRDNEPGTPLVLTGQVRDINGAPLPGAEVDLWHADSEGYYSGFAPHIPEGNLRGVFVTDEEGRFEISTIEPAPYQIPTDGPTGKLINAAGWHAWRPAHLHIMVTAEGHRPVTTQLYFGGGEYLDSDIAEATKPELILHPKDDGAGGKTEVYNFELEPA